MPFNWEMRQVIEPLLISLNQKFRVFVQLGNSNQSTHAFNWTAQRSVEEGLSGAATAVLAHEPGSAQAEPIT